MLSILGSKPLIPFVYFTASYQDPAPCIDLTPIPTAKYFMDPAGHYSTPGNMQLFVDASRQKLVFILGEEDPETLSYEDIQFEAQ